MFSGKYVSGEARGRQRGHARHVRQAAVLYVQVLDQQVGGGQARVQALRHALGTRGARPQRGRLAPARRADWRAPSPRGAPSRRLRVSRRVHSSLQFIYFGFELFDFFNL